MRYIDADKLIDKIFPIGLIDDGKYTINAKAIKMAVDSCPTADVVPKSEYDAVVSAVDNSTKEFLKLHDDYQDAIHTVERLKNILDSYAFQYGTVTDKQAIINHERVEVAREIFEEIERLLNLNSFQGDIFTGKYFDVELETDIAELKKKYTEGEK